MTRAKLLYLVTEDWYFVSDTLPLAIAAKEAGYDVFVATRVNKHGGKIQETGLNLIPLQHISRSGIGPVRESRSISEIVNVYRRIRPDIVHHIALKPVIYGSIAARTAKGIAVVNSIMGLGYVFSSSSAKARLLRPIVRAALQSALARSNTRTIVQNRDDFADITRMVPSAALNLRLVRGSGVDGNRFKFSPTPTGTPLIVLPGRMLRDKGVVEFAEAARLLKAQGVAARFALVGPLDPDNRAAISQDDIAAWVRDGIVEYWGSQTDMPAVFTSASVVCLPSYREGLPRVLLEAAASGRAIVTTDVPGCREIVQHDVNGLLVPARNAHALAAALHRLIADPVLCARLAAAGRALIEAEFTLPRIIAETLAVYAET